MSSSSALTIGLKSSLQIIGSANTLGFLITAITRTHKITDLIGCGSFVLLTLFYSRETFPLLLLKHTQQQATIRNSISSLLQNRLIWMNSGVILWGIRLSTYLFTRVLKIGEDKRLRSFIPSHSSTEKWFDKTKTNFPLNLAFFWTLQALWAMIVLLPLSMVNSLLISSLSTSSSLLNSLEISSVLGWLPVLGMITGIVVESLADYQKTLYRSNEKNNGHWCDTGLWYYSRYPNYFGEILTWWSIYFLALPSLMTISKGLLLPTIAILSPLFITWLLLKVSGIPLLERKQLKEYGQREDFLQYVRETPLLIPWPFKTTAAGKTKSN